MEVIRIIIDEHQSLAGILHAIRHMIREFGQGTLQPDFGLLKAMVEYLEAYPEKRHHPKEDRYLFALLRRRTGEGSEAMARLEQEHAHADARIAELRRALAAYAAGDAGGYDGFARAFEAYADFYRSHMLIEEREILPLIRQHFTAADWQAAEAGFATLADPPREGHLPGSQEDFRHLFSRLVSAAPPPVGLGAGPYDAGEAAPRSRRN